MNPIHTITSQELLTLSHQSGMILSDEILERLVQHRILRPLANAPERPFCVLHLLVLFEYFQRVRVVAHPWESPQQVDVSDIIEGSVEVSELADLIMSDGAPSHERVDAILARLELAFRSANPFGPLRSMLDLLRPELVEQFQGDGRLFFVLRDAHQRLQDWCGGLEEISDALSVSESESEVVEDDSLEEPSTPEPEEAQEPEAPLRPRMRTTQMLTERVEPSTLLDDEAGEVEGVVPGEVAPPDMRGSADAEPTPESLRLTAEMPPLVPPPRKANPFLRENQEVSSSQRTLDIKSRIAALQKTDESEAEEEVAEDAPLHQEASFEGDEEMWGVEVTQAITRDDLRVETLMTEADIKEEAELQADAATLEEVPEAPTSEVPEASLGQQIEELNRRRAEYYAQENWEGLVRLYEQGIDLFEGEDLLQVYMMLAKLYEAKLGDVQTALENVALAFGLATGAATTAVIREMQRIVESSDSAFAWWETWVREHLRAHSARPQRSLALLRVLAGEQQRRGESERAFWTFASFVADNAAAVISAEVLETLESLARGGSEDELEALYEDLLDQEGSDAWSAPLRLKLGMRYVERDELTLGIRELQRVLRAQPDNDTVYHTLEQLYDETSLWSDLVLLYEARLSLHPEMEESLGERLERTRTRQTDDLEKAVAHYEKRLEMSTGDEEAMARLAYAYDAAGRHAEAYASLNRHVASVSTKALRVSMLMMLARIASEHLYAPEEGVVHYEQVLALEPGHSEATASLQRLRES